MNIDAVIVARYFYTVPESLAQAMERVYDSFLEHKPYNNIYPDATEITRYFNEIPKEVHEALKRILEVTD